MPDPDRWRAEAVSVSAAAARMVDSEARTTMWQIAIGYRQMAEHAERRRAGAPAVPSGVTFGPEALRAIGEAFDQAWGRVAHHFGDDPLRFETARAQLASALLSVADEDSRDVSALRDAALSAFALSYRKEA
jgi:hypothetical protein